MADKAWSTAARWRAAYSPLGEALLVGTALGLLHPLAEWSLQDRPWALAGMAVDVTVVTLVVVALVRQRERRRRACERAAAEGNVRVLMTPASARATDVDPEVLRAQIELAMARSGRRGRPSGR